jgi:L-asparaginase type I
MSVSILVLTTGGTIGHSSRRGMGAALDFDPAELITQLSISGVDITFKKVFRKGSMDIVPDDWQLLASSILEAQSGSLHGVVVLHGTDTLQYTASALTFMLGDCGVPIAITGSMIPGGDAGTDALANLRDAITVAARADFAEVCVVFSADTKRSGGLIIRGCRARKVHSTAINAFASINCPPIGEVFGDEIVRTHLPVRPRSIVQRRAVTTFDPNVILVKLTPNLAPEALTRCLLGSSGAVLEGTGIGHIRTDLQPVIAQFGKPVVISTQALYGGEQLGRYEVDQRILALPNVIQGGDMPSETALVKLMWVLAEGGDVATRMRMNVAGELDEGALPSSNCTMFPMSA